MIRTLALLVSGLTLTTCLHTEAQQEVQPIEMGTLPMEVDESSGLAAASVTSLWTLNDHGGKAEIYEIDIRGELVRTVKLIGVEPEDMEDMAQDEQGNLYLADTGNNKQKRDRLSIYKLNVADITGDSVRPEVIEFVLPDDGLNSECHYDFEAMTWSRNKLYIFSKDRCDEKDNSLMLYSLPDAAGLHTADFIGEFFWEDPDLNIKITSADIGVDGRKLALLSNDALHFFFAYKKDEFFDGAYRYFPLKKSRKEALIHMTECDLYISEESSKGKKGRLWKLNLCNINWKD
ncbi:MAG: hypothetical protein HKN79_06895 [Flavobacteriales bacterium]|nr:hypothetical protein [Flavobacteriales bacterium]